MADKKETKEKKTDVHQEENENYPMTAGQQFVKAIGPFGCILFLTIFILFMVFCFTGGVGK